MRLDLLQQIHKEPLQKDLLPGIKARISKEQAEQLPVSTAFTLLILVGMLLSANAFFVAQNLNREQDAQNASLITNIKTDNQLYR